MAKLESLQQLVRRYPMLYIRWRILDSGDAVWVHRQIFNTELCIGRPETGEIRDAWSYETDDAALVAYRAWNPLEAPEPQGWVRHPRTGRRRANGDPSTEVVRK